MVQRGLSGSSAYEMSQYKWRVGRILSGSAYLLRIHHNCLEIICC